MKYFIIISLFWAMPAKAQLSEDLARLREEYKKEELHCYKVMYSGYENYSSTVPLDTQTSLYIHRGVHNYYLENPGQVTFRRGDKTVVIDEELKQMLLFATPEMSESLYNFPLDSVLKICSGIKLLEETESERIYRLGFEAPFEYSRIELTLDISRQSLKKLVLYFSGEMEIQSGEEYKYVKPRMEVEYFPVEPTEKHRQKLDIEQYLSQTATNTFSPSKNYSDYEIINNLSVNR